jgi:SAM-dependent methyltransferase
MPDKSEPSGQQEPTEADAELLHRILNEPRSDDVWRRTVELARAEEASGRGSDSYYGRIPLEDLIAIGERLRAAESREDQYGILAEKTSTGEYWYDIVLGHVNDKMFAPIKTELESLAEGKPDKKFEAGLDIGSGLGNTSRAISPYFKKVTGIEKLPQIVEKVKGDPTMPENVEIVPGDATKLPFADESFDAAVSNGLAHYLEKDEMEKYVREISRVLKDGGMYFEALGTKDPNSELPATETEYLTSAKALLVCLLDNTVSKVEEGSHEWSLSDMVKAFKREGVDYSKVNDYLETDGVIVAKFTKHKN